jgi:hypothetical protein
LQSGGAFVGGSGVGGSGVGGSGVGGSGVGGSGVGGSGVGGSGVGGTGVGGSAVGGSFVGGSAVGGTGVGGTGVGGSGVLVGGRGVRVGRGVLVGGTGVLVGGIGVLVGGTAVLVGGIGVLEGGTAVLVGVVPGGSVAAGVAVFSRGVAEALAALVELGALVAGVRPIPPEPEEPDECESCEALVLCGGAVLPAFSSPGRLPPVPASAPPGALAVFGTALALPLGMAVLGRLEALMRVGSIKSCATLLNGAASAARYGVAVGGAAVASPISSSSRLLASPGVWPSAPPRPGPSGELLEALAGLPEPKNDVYGPDENDAISGLMRLSSVVVTSTTVIQTPMTKATR